MGIDTAFMKISSDDIGLNDENLSAPTISFGVFPLTVPPPSISYFFASILFPFYAANFAARLL